MRKIKVLHLVPAVNYGGIESFIANNISESISTQIISLSRYKSPQCDFFKSKGVSVLHQQYSFFLMRLFYIAFLISRSRYDIIHIHLSHISWIYILFSLVNFRKKIVIHSHNYFLDETLIVKAQRLLTRFLSFFCHRVACSYEAGDYLFGKLYFKILFNQINLDEFSFKANNRTSRKLNIGFVGKFIPQKNPIAALNIYTKYFYGHKLFLIGDGDLRDDVFDFIEKSNISSFITYKTISRNMREDLKYIDLLLAPSKHEGFGFLIIEALSSGCLCIISENFPSFIKNLDNVFVLNEKFSFPDRFISDYNRKKNSVEIIASLRSSGLDLDHLLLSRYYKSIL